MEPGEYDSLSDAAIDMGHSIFKERSHPYGSGVGKCPGGQIFDFTSERDMNIKL